MAEKITPHSVPELIYVKLNSNYRGYKQELIRDEIPEGARQFLVCPKCSGIIREPRHYKEETVCQYCTTGPLGNVDQKVQSNVVELKCVCPLSNRGCNWCGNISSLHQHVEGCDKLLVPCPLKCDFVLQICEIEQHTENRCRMRRIECEYCGERVEARRQNEHLKNCKKYPLSEVACPFTKIGCEKQGIILKNLEQHQRENMVTHQHLMLTEYSQYKASSEEMKNTNEVRHNKQEGEIERLKLKCQEMQGKLNYLEGQEKELKNNTRTMKREKRSELTYVLITMFFILVMLITNEIRLKRHFEELSKFNDQRETKYYSEFETLKSEPLRYAEIAKENKERLVKLESSLKQTTSDIKTEIRSSVRKIETKQQEYYSEFETLKSESLRYAEIAKENKERLVKLESSLKQTTSDINIEIRSSVREIETKQQERYSEFETLKRRLGSLTNYSRYIKRRGRVLNGIEWHYEGNDFKERIYGPTLYVGLCKYRISIQFNFNEAGEQISTIYEFLTRIQGDYDDVTNTCNIYFWYNEFENEANINKHFVTHYLEFAVEKTFKFVSTINEDVEHILKGNQFTLRVYLDPNA